MPISDLDVPRRPSDLTTLSSQSNTQLDTSLRSTSRQLRELPLRAAAVGRRRNLGRRSAALGHALVFLANFLRDAAGVGDARGVPKITVNSHKIRGHSIDADIVDNDIARASVVGAVAAAAVHFADSDESRVFDRHGTAAVVLDDLVFGRVGSAALPKDVAVAEGGDGV